MKLNHHAAAGALLSLVAAAACTPVCTPIDGTPDAPANPFGMSAPVVGDQSDAYDGRFTITQGDQTFTVVTTQIRPGETYQEARDRPFFESQRGSRAFERGIVVPSYYNGFFIGIPQQTHNPLGGNAVPYGIEVGGKVIPFADMEGMQASGFNTDEADYIEEVAYRHTNMLNEGGEGVGSYFRTYRTPVELRDNPQGAADMLQAAVDRTNEELGELFTGTAGTPGAACPVAQGMTSSGFGDVYVTGDAEPREPGKPFPLVPVIATLLGVAAVAAVANRLLKKNKFETLYVDATENEEIVVLRDTNLGENDPNGFVVFERKQAKEPKAQTVQKNDNDGRIGDVKKRGKYWVQKGRTAKQYSEITAALKAEKDDFIITTGNQKLWNKIQQAVVADDAEATRKAIRQVTKRHDGPKRGKIVGMFSPIALKKRMAEGVQTLASNDPERPETAALLEIAQTLRTGKPMPLNDKPDTLIP